MECAYPPPYRSRDVEVEDRCHWGAAGWGREKLYSQSPVFSRRDTSSLQRNYLAYLFIGVFLSEVAGQVCCGVVNEAIEDGVGEGGIGDRAVPFLDGQLTGDQR